MKIEDLLLLGAAGYLVLSHQVSAAPQETASVSSPITTPPAVSGTGQLGSGVKVSYVNPTTGTTYGTYNT
ncbi:hypothetical protein, partial [Listeria monocytogenes]|uniref:hypothetical protein n=1 Tax=Listeria monocytogenes TaxID=1639 RepID=UPI002FDBA473